MECCNLLKNPLSKQYNYQSHMNRCKVYKDHLKSNCIDDGFNQQLKHDILNEFDGVEMIWKMMYLMLKQTKR